MAWKKSGRVLVVGLGNPGAKYAGTRHNIGFMLAQALAEVAGVSLSRQKFHGFFGTGEWRGRSLAILLPQTFMNRSGQSVVPALDFFDLPPGQMVVLHDELDLPLGDVRLKVGGGHGGHNGLRSIIELTGNRDFLRIRQGIGRPILGSVTSHVLGPFTSDEVSELHDVFERGLLALEHLIDSGPKSAMDAVNGLYRSQLKREEEVKDG